MKRWLAGYRAAERRALQEMRDAEPLDSETSFAAAMELCDLVNLPLPDPQRERELLAARAAWAKIRAWAASRA